MSQNNSNNNNNNEFILTVRYLNRGFSLTIDKDQFVKINDNEITIFVQPNHLEELEAVIKDLNEIKASILMVGHVIKTIKNE